MILSTHRNRLALVRLVVASMPECSLERLVSLLYMRNYCDIDVRDELSITQKALRETRQQIKDRFVNAGICGY